MGCFLTILQIIIGSLEGGWLLDSSLMEFSNDNDYDADRNGREYHVVVDLTVLTTVGGAERTEKELDNAAPRVRVNFGQILSES